MTRTGGLSTYPAFCCLEVVSMAADQAGSQHFGLVVVLIVVVILDERESLSQRDARNEYRADPIVDQSAGNCKGVLGVAILDRQLPLANLSHPLRFFINPQK